ncbi:Ig-like domain-containing protein [Vibrio lentus]|nr:Ig-like domain-containing protein [Vibrio lentus]
MQKTRLRRPKKNTVLNDGIAGGTDVDGTVSYQLVDDVTEGSLTFNDDGSYTFTPGSDFDDLPVGQDRDVSLHIHRDRQRHRRERAGPSPLP